MSSAASSRAPIFLLLVVAAGLGVRAASASHAAADSAACVAPLDSQIARVRGAGSRPSPSKPKRSKKASPVAPPLERSAPDAGAIRSEKTPFGALPADRLVSERASVERRENKREAPVRPTPRPTVSVVVNIETATAEEIESLPGIGPSLARRIAEDRRKGGPFGSLEGLQRVRGVGPVLAARLVGRVTFNVAGRP